MAELPTEQLGKLLGLLVHDLRNPGATIGANLSFVAESLRDSPDGDIREALQDVERALGDLMLGLEHIGWIGRWLSNEPALIPQPGDVVETLRSLRAPPEELNLEIDAPSEPVLVRAAGKGLAKLVQIFVENAVQHARRGVITVRVRPVNGEQATVDIVDEGMPLDPSLHETAFTLEGQMAIKGRAEGRYGRVAGLLAAKVLAEAIGARIEPTQFDSRACFRIHLPLAV